MTDTSPKPNTAPNVVRIWSSPRATLIAGRTVAALAVLGGAWAGLLYQRINVERARTLQRSMQNDLRVARLDAQASFDLDRRNLVDAIAEQMRWTDSGGTELGPEERQTLADLIVGASEQYPAVDPVLLGSVGAVDLRLSSPQATRTPRLYRLQADAARRLAEEVGWTYDDDILQDPRRSAELAARHLAQLQSAYNDTRMVLAEYDGGPLDAGYLRARTGRLSSRTRTFVHDVLETYQRIQRALPPRSRHLFREHLRSHRAGTLPDLGSGLPRANASPP